MTRWRPSHAYVPGQTPRHAEGIFDGFEFHPQTIEKSERWQLALAFLTEKYFWEAHELLEPIWMACPEGSHRKRLVQGLIQLANAGLKARMGRTAAVNRLREIAATLIKSSLADAQQVILGLDRRSVSELWRAALDEEMMLA